MGNRPELALSEKGGGFLRLRLELPILSSRAALRGSFDDICRRTIYPGQRMSDRFDNVPGGAPPKKKYVRAVGPRLRVLLAGIFGLVALLGANSVYLSTITFLEWLNRAAGVTFQNYFYQSMFLAHLALGLLLVLPVIISGVPH